MKELSIFEFLKTGVPKSRIEAIRHWVGNGSYLGAVSVGRSVNKTTI